MKLSTNDNFFGNLSIDLKTADVTSSGLYILTMTSENSDAFKMTIVSFLYKVWRWLTPFVKVIKVHFISVGSWNDSANISEFPYRFYFGFFWNGKSNLCRLLFCKNMLNKRKENRRKMKRKMKMKKKKRIWDAKSVSIWKHIISSTILQSFNRKHPIVTEKLTYLSKPNLLNIL